MRKVDELRNVIANQFACEYKTYDFGEICNAFIDDLIRINGKIVLKMNKAILVDIRRTEKYEKILRRKTWFTYKATTDRF